MIVINWLLPTIFQHEDFYSHLYYCYMPGFTISSECYPSFHQKPLTWGYLSLPKYEYVPIFSYLLCLWDCPWSAQAILGWVSNDESKYTRLFLHSPLLNPIFRHHQSSMSLAFVRCESIGKLCWPWLFPFLKAKAPLRLDIPDPFQTRCREEGQQWQRSQQYVKFSFSC